MRDHVLATPERFLLLAANVILAHLREVYLENAHLLWQVEFSPDVTRNFVVQLHLHFVVSDDLL